MSSMSRRNARCTGLVNLLLRRRQSSWTRRLVLLVIAQCAIVGALSAQLLPSSMAPEARGSSTPPPACEDGVVKDDGSLETGYGWVPSAVDGRYVQEYEYSEFPQRGLLSVCVCWTRSRTDEDLDFVVELYRLQGEGLPRLDPELSIPTTAAAVPAFPEGQFYEVPIPAVPLPPGRFAIGVRWNPSVDDFFFVCADQSQSLPFTNGWFIDDRADNWAQIFDAADPIFADHTAMLIRPVSGPAVFPTDIPTAANWALLVLAATLGTLALRLLGAR